MVLVAVASVLPALKSSRHNASVSLTKPDEKKLQSLINLVTICCYNSIPARQDIPIYELVQSRGIEQSWARCPNHLCCVGFGCLAKKV